MEIFRLNLNISNLNEVKGTLNVLCGRLAAAKTLVIDLALHLPPTPPACGRRFPPDDTWQLPLAHQHCTNYWLAYLCLTAWDILSIAERDTSERTMRLQLQVETLYWTGYTVLAIRVGGVAKRCHVQCKTYLAQRSTNSLKFSLPVRGARETCFYLGSLLSLEMAKRQAHGM